MHPITSRANANEVFTRADKEIETRHLHLWKCVHTSLRTGCLVSLGFFPFLFVPRHSDHPGGAGPLMANLGKDATDDFDALHSESVRTRTALTRRWHALSLPSVPKTRCLRHTYRFPRPVGFHSMLLSRLQALKHAEPFLVGVLAQSAKL